jgi:hypothetical protein
MSFSIKMEKDIWLAEDKKVGWSTDMELQLFADALTLDGFLRYLMLITFMIRS